MIQHLLLPTPTEVRSVGCPYCKVKPGDHCMGVRRKRKANHRERVKVFIDQRREEANG